MTTEEVLAIYTEMEWIYGSLPDPIREPIRFEYMVKLYGYHKKQQGIKEVQ